MQYKMVFRIKWSENKRKVKQESGNVKGKGKRDKGWIEGRTGEQGSEEGETEEKEEGGWLDGGKTEDKGLKEGDEGEEKMRKAGRSEQVSKEWGQRRRKEELGKRQSGILVKILKERGGEGRWGDIDGRVGGWGRGEGLLCMVNDDNDCIGRTNGG